MHFELTLDPPDSLTLWVAVGLLALIVAITVYFLVASALIRQMRRNVIKTHHAIAVTAAPFADWCTCPLVIPHLRGDCLNAERKEDDDQGAGEWCEETTCPVWSEPHKIGDHVAINGEVLGVRSKPNNPRPGDVPWPKPTYPSTPLTSTSTPSDYQWKTRWAPHDTQQEKTP